MADCAYCELMGKKENRVFEDGEIAVVMADKPAARGHMLVLPKQHVPILEQAPKGLVGKLLNVANKFSGHVVIGPSHGDFHGLGKKIVIGCLRARMFPTSRCTSCQGEGMTA